MPFSFHSHSGQFCHHGYGSLEQVVKEAHRKGFRIYGLSEHMPRFRAENLYPEEIEAGCDITSLNVTFNKFLDEARRLQAAYKTPQILVGTEIEFIDESYAIHVETIRPKVDYIVGSLHHVAGIPIDFSQDMYNTALVNHGGDLAALFATYFDEQHTMLCRIKPNVVAHFDLIRIFAGDELKAKAALTAPKVWEKVCRNVEFVISYGGLFEINSRAWKKGLEDAYPHKEVVKLVQKLHGRFTLSDDCHGYNDVGMFYDKLHQYLCDSDIHTIHYLDLQDGKVVVKENNNMTTDVFWEQMKKW